LSLRRIRAEDDDPKKAALRAAQVKALASTVEFTEELEGFFRKRLPERTRLCELDAKLVSEPPVVSTEWNLNPGCIAKGIDRADSSVGSVALLPERITLHLFTRIDEMPFNPGNLTESDKGLPWVRSIHRPQRPKADDFRSQSSLELIPNGLAAHRAVYQMQYVGTEELRALGGGAEVMHRYGRLSLWEGRRQ